MRILPLIGLKYYRILRSASASSLWMTAEMSAKSHHSIPSGSIFGRALPTFFSCLSVSAPGDNFTSQRTYPTWPIFKTSYAKSVSDFRWLQTDRAVRRCRLSVRRNLIWGSPNPLLQSSQTSFPLSSNALEFRHFVHLFHCFLCLLWTWKTIRLWELKKHQFSGYLSPGYFQCLDLELRKHKICSTKKKPVNYVFWQYWDDHNNVICFHTNFILIQWWCVAASFHNQLFPLFVKKTCFLNELFGFFLNEVNWLFLWST